ncbi:hypothetical protein [Paenibacillus radicis (ex Gao et al. 2016)]|uniref:hypothetical protein n=1 Tax=Paenibacillus radicis (ex Gao et al. 2016) TaxID=1737354 RepID=UPI00166EDF2F|nr:hypothetical protein [Paenibacillus radicis (ex Gao et al. 2016)]
MGDTTGKRERGTSPSRVEPRTRYARLCSIGTDAAEAFLYVRRSILLWFAKR